MLLIIPRELGSGDLGLPHFRLDVTCHRKAKQFIKINPSVCRGLKFTLNLFYVPVSEDYDHFQPSTRHGRKNAKSLVYLSLVGQFPQLFCSMTRLLRRSQEWTARQVELTFQTEFACIPVKGKIYHIISSEKLLSYLLKKSDHANTSPNS